MNWFVSLFKKPVQPVPHVIIPQNLMGSPDWVQPTVNNPSGSWFPYFSTPYESQLAPAGFYQDNCVVRACLDAVEAQLNYLISKAPQGDLVAKFLKDYYCNNQGYVKLSVRYTSQVSNVQLGLGTSISNVLDGFAIYGLVPESVYPELTGNYTWDQYMQPIPQNILDYGKKSTTFFKILWNVLWNLNWNAPNIPALQSALITSPVIFASQIGNINGNGVEVPTTYLQETHCRVVANIDNVVGVFDVLDNYLINGKMTRELSEKFPLATAVTLQVKII